MTHNLRPLSDSFQANRLALHRVAAYVLSPTRRQAMGRMGLRATPGGFGTPAFLGSDGMMTVGVEGVEIVVWSDSGLRRAPLTTLSEIGKLAGTEPDVGWAAELDIPDAGDLDADLNIEAEDAGALAAWFAFGWGILEKLSMDRDSESASEPQLWPEHFDPAIEIGDPQKNRASFGFSPGDVNRDATEGSQPLPYVYVAPWFPDRAPEDPFWSNGRLAVLRYVDLVAEANPAATARDFLLQGRNLLAK